jgi:heme/copper-type cytochrome/quinol oxidase subunit 2
MNKNLFGQIWNLVLALGFLIFQLQYWDGQYQVSDMKTWGWFFAFMILLFGFIPWITLLVIYIHVVFGKTESLDKDWKRYANASGIAISVLYATTIAIIFTPMTGPWYTNMFLWGLAGFFISWTLYSNFIDEVKKMIF